MGSCARMFALALRAWVAIVGSAGAKTLSQLTLCCDNDEQKTIILSELQTARAMSDSRIEASVRDVLFGTEGCYLDRVPEVHTIEQKDNGTPPDDSITPFKYPSLGELTHFELSSLLSREWLHFDLTINSRDVRI